MDRWWFRSGSSFIYAYGINSFHHVLPGDLPLLLKPMDGPIRDLWPCQRFALCARNPIIRQSGDFGDSGFRFFSPRLLDVILLICSPAFSSLFVHVTQRWNNCFRELCQFKGNRKYTYTLVPHNKPTHIPSPLCSWPHTLALAHTIPVPWTQF